MIKSAQVDPAILEICRKVKITDYLKKRGVEVLRSGSRERCKCPLGTHRDSDPSCYIRTNADGSQMFKCFGCSVAGNIITIMAAMESIKKGAVIRNLAGSVGVSLAKFDEKAAKIEPLLSETDELFCEEHALLQDISQYGVRFMQEYCAIDAVNKVSRLYEMIDEMAELGNTNGVSECYKKLRKLMKSYGVEECQESTEKNSTQNTPE